MQLAAGVGDGPAAPSDDPKDHHGKEREEKEKTMQHKRSRLTTKILAFVLILALVFPASAFASVADVAKDTRAPGKSLANTYPAYTDIEWQISLAENAQAMVTVPTNMTEEELGTALSGDLTLSLDRDSTRGYLNPEKFPYPYQGGALDTCMCPRSPWARPPWTATTCLI